MQLHNEQFVFAIQDFSGLLTFYIAAASADYQPPTFEVQANSYYPIEVTEETEELIDLIKQPRRPLALTGYISRDSGVLLQNLIGRKVLFYEASEDRNFLNTPPNYKGILLKCDNMWDDIQELYRTTVEIKVVES
ncbi:hypothetical protein [Brevibacillus brevis]|uniref:hypothetical protein n=1 Tax=Brevibacillus brevis TaxID=1393 RepID=UPI000D0E783E|nr:hypothetical protein [Brevibacillus brevis]PSJ67443.1 hypothetical protein C7J99_20850 [Brevibacillus brevis]RED28429.1 hypothetical protein DES34_108296 [Brevibacillus brevis]GEC90683.1 hypothetical protein BBR01nite_30140 [Brevibacillus brevis]VEF91124.1 Uncharacterised protein [Brevibacillus brevis]